MHPPDPGARRRDVYVNALGAAKPTTDTHDWGRAYEQHAPALLRYARRLTKSADEAGDVVQEAFLNAMRSASPPRDDHRLRLWLYRIVSNEIIDRHRRRRFLFLPLGEVQVAAEPIDGSELGLVRRALQSIPSEQAVALVLRLHEGRSRSEIAAMLGLSEEGVKSRLARGRLNFAAAYRRLERGLAQ